MSKMKDLRKQMKKQLKEFEEQIETFGEQAEVVEAATLKRSQERLVNLVDAIDAQLKVWQNGMTEVSGKLDGSKTNGASANLNTEIKVGADALWQLETLRALETTAGEKVRALKNAQNGERDALKETAEQALGDLKHALQRVLPE
jgi:hypothetical protein